MTASATKLETRILGLSLIAAPILLLISTLFHLGGSDKWSGTAQVHGIMLFIPAGFALASFFARQAPRVAVVARSLVVLGSAGGIGYGVSRAIIGAAEDAGLGADVIAELTAIEDTGIPLALNALGLLFPLAFAFVGFNLWRTRVVPRWAGLAMVAAAFAFPFTRIPDIAQLYPVSDLLFVISFGFLGFRYVTSATVQAAPTQATALAARA